VGLDIGPGALEAREEGVVDVDGAAFELLAEVVGEDLHIAGEDDKVDVELIDKLKQPRLRGGLGLRRHGDVVEGDAVGLRQGLEVTVIGHNRRDLDVEGSGAAPEKQIVEAVTELGHHDQGAGGGQCVAHLPGDPILLGYGGETVTQCFQLRARIRHLEVHPHEKAVLEPVVELLALQDVAGVPHEVAGHRVDQSGSVRTGESEDELAAGLRSRRHMDPPLVRIAQHGV
jgi:hypothetical protein